MKLEISLHDGTTEIVEVENYDAVENYKILNGEKKNEAGNVYSSIMIGNNIYATVSVKSIRVVGGVMK